MMMTILSLVSLVLLPSCLCRVTQEALSPQDIELTGGSEETKLLNVEEGRVCVLLREDCEDAGSGLQVRAGECVERRREVKVEDSRRICSADGDKVCHSPCYNCPMACRKTIKTVCTLRHELVNNVTVSGGVLREEENLMRNITCVEEEEENLCAPVNCNFVNISSACTEILSPPDLVEVVNRECPLCQPWTKHCAATREEVQDFLQEELPTSISSSQVIPAERTIQSLKKDLLLIIKKEEKLMQENLRMMTRLKPENVNVNIKYNIVTEKYNEIDTVDPILSLLDNVIEIPTQKPELSHNVVSRTSNASSDTRRENKELYASSSVIIRTTTTTATTTTTTATTTTITTTTTTVTTTTTSTATPTTTVKHKSASLSAADFLRLCFISGQGCDFNQDFSTSRQPETTTKPPSTLPPTQSPEDQEKKALKERLRQRLKLCFFSGVCGNDQKRPKDRRPRIISSDRNKRKTSQTSARREKLKRIIQKKARACFLEGNC